MQCSLLLRVSFYVLVVCFSPSHHAPIVIILFPLPGVFTDYGMQSKVPPPLQVQPSRARRQFALRLAQRKAQLESTREQEDDPEDPDAFKTQEQEEREGHQRFARMFEGIDDSSDEEDLGDIEGIGEEDDILGRIDIGAGKDVLAAGESHVHQSREGTDKEEGEEKEGEGESKVVVV